VEAVRRRRANRRSEESLDSLRLAAAGLGGIQSDRTAFCRKRDTLASMTSGKPEVPVPSEQPPSYQLELEDIALGDGEEAVPGRVVEVHYVGVSWKTGQQFDASWDRGSTFKFPLGKGQVIPGWDRGVVGMKVGGRRRLTIPPDLAYGKRGAGRAIGPDETLVFVVDLIGLH